MAAFEYKLVNHDNSGRDVRDVLEELGREGWLLVHDYRWQMVPNMSTMYLARPVEDETQLEELAWQLLPLANQVLWMIDRGFDVVPGEPNVEALRSVVNEGKEINGRINNRRLAKTLKDMDPEQGEDKHEGLQGEFREE